MVSLSKVMIRNSALLYQEILLLRSAVPQPRPITGGVLHTENIPICMNNGNQFSTESLRDL